MSETPTPRDTPRGSLHHTERALARTLAQQGHGRYGDLDARGVAGAGPELRPAAVLLLLERTPGYQVVLTKRTDLVEHHKGEISLAGGMADPGDRDAEHTALREAHEELGIDPDDVSVLGQLGELVTVTGFAVRPVVGAIDAGYPMVPQETEVERILRVPLTVLRDPHAWFEDVRLWRGERHVLRSVRWQGEIIWGATSRILQRFLDVVPPEIL